jgi:class 3 adenylate cyclase
MKARSLPRPIAVGIERYLAFDDFEVERDFRNEDNQAAVGRARLTAILAIVLSLPFATVDLLIAQQSAWVLVGIRAMALGGFLALIAVSMWWKSAGRHVQWIACGATVFYAWCAAAGALATDAPREYARTATTLLLLALVGVTRVRFRPATITTALIVPPVEYVLIEQRDSWDAALLESLGLVTFGILAVTVAFVLERSKRIAFLAQRDLTAERTRSDDLLHNILPEPIAQRLRENPSAIAESADEATVLFADIVGFTPFSSELPPDEVVELLDLLFGKFDDLCEDRGIYKVKTIGDAYMAVAGIPRPDPDHAASIVELAFDMQRAATAIAPLWPTDLMLRIGISSGPVVAGVIGHKRFAYDLWGDTVNTASRMESHGLPNRIQVSEPTYELLRDRYAFGDPHEMDIKGKGAMPTYFLLGPEPY